ncbi:MAG: FAD-dependent oxidoreductase [Acidimicrobiales bacterium]
MARDVIVIGAGGGGAVIAKELAERGLDVLVLEAGPRFADPEAEWTSFENDAINPVTGFHRFGPSDRSRPAWVRELPQNSFLWQLAGVGGTTQHYFANSPRAMPGAFSGYAGADAAAYDRHHPFPFAYRELIPYYEWVEHTLPVQTAAMGTKEEVFLRGAERAGLVLQRGKDISGDSFRPQENAILQPGGTAGVTGVAAELVWPKATGCTFCGYCFHGCTFPRAAPRNLKAKRSTDNSYVPMALTAGAWKAGGKAVTLITDAFATNIDTAVEGGRTVAKGVTWRTGDQGEAVSEEARVVIMAAGAVENPRLWFNSGLPDPNGAVGRRFTDHFFDWMVGVMPVDTFSSKGPSSAARADFPGRGSLIQTGVGPATQAVTMGFSDHGVQGGYTNGLGSTGAWDGQSGRLVGPALRETMESFDRLVNILVMTDDDVEAQNRVTLSSLLPADEHGPVPKVIFNHRHRSPRTVANREYLVQRSVDILRAAGATKVMRMGWGPLVLHAHSTMRMGTREGDSVLDPNAEARGVAGLFVADNSALANSIGGPNPTLTTQALATRTAEKVFALYFGGDPWVGREAPVSSIDDAVTHAVLGRSGPAPSTRPATGGDERLPATGSDDLRRAAIAAAALGGAAAVRWPRRRPPPDEQG